jgi:hypothetical protein
MDRSRKRLESIEDRLSFIGQETQAPGFARLFSAAREPFAPANGGRKGLVRIVALLSVLLALAIPIAIDMLDSRILTPDEAEKLLGFPPLGFTYCANRIDLAQRIDRVRRFAAAIEREMVRGGSRSYLFVPVNNLANVTELIVEASEALGSLGHKVRVISPDGICPESQEVLVASGGHSEVSSETCRASISDSFGAMRTEVARAAACSDAVLVATAPFTEVGEAELLASGCDVVILVLQAGQTTKMEVKAATRTLERIQPKAVAVLVAGYEPNPPMEAPRISVSFARKVSAALRSSSRPVGVAK